MFVVRKGEKEISHIRADQVKLGDFVVHVFHSLTKDILLAEIVSITKMKVASKDMQGIITEQGYFVGITLLSTQENECKKYQFQNTPIAKQVQKFLQSE
eukprot:403366762